MYTVCLLFTTTSKHSSDGSKIVNPSPDCFARPRQWNVTSGVTSAMKATTSATFVLSRARSNHILKEKQFTLTAKSNLMISVMKMNKSIKPLLSFAT